MKKLIATISTVMGLTFALALAGTNEESPGTAGTQSSDQQSEQAPPSDSRDTRASNTCIDENGVTYQPGESGFERCMDAATAAKKAQDEQPKEERAGQVPESSASDIPGATH